VVGFMGTNARALGCTTRADMGDGKSKNEAGCGWMDMEMCGGCLCVCVLLSEIREEVSRDARR
jgi:hypothetical protein